MLLRARDGLAAINGSNLITAMGCLLLHDVEWWVQQAEIAAEAEGYTATRHQREVGTGYFDQVQKVISGGLASTVALHDSTEKAQF